MQKFTPDIVVAITLSLILEERAVESDQTMAGYCSSRGLPIQPSSDGILYREWAEALRSGNRIPRTRTTSAIYAKVRQSFRIRDDVSSIFLEEEEGSN